MTYQHKDLAAGRWQKLSFFEQMANIGSEVIRAIGWRDKKKNDYAVLSSDRALELLSLTIDDLKNRYRLKELTRLYECLADYLYCDNIYHSDKQKTINYFLAFNYACRIKNT